MTTATLSISANSESHTNRTVVRQTSVECGVCGLPDSLIGGKCNNCRKSEEASPPEPFPRKVLAVLAICIGVVLAGVVYAGRFI